MKNKVKEYRLKKGYSVRELAEIIGTSNESVYKYEKGVRTPSPKKMIKLSEVFGESVDVLFFAN